MLWPRLARNLVSRPLTEPPPAIDPEEVAELAAQLDATARRRLGRSLAIRQVDAGSCNGCELEINATQNVVHDLERFGLRFVASPRHADVLLVTGPVTRNMREALERTRNATPDPCFIIAVGDCAVDGGVFKGSYAVEGGLAAEPRPGEAAFRPDLRVGGCPPTPTQIIRALLTLLATQE